MFGRDFIMYFSSHCINMKMTCILVSATVVVGCQLIKSEQNKYIQSINGQLTQSCHHNRNNNNNNNNLLFSLACMGANFHCVTFSHLFLLVIKRVI